MRLLRSRPGRGAERLAGRPSTACVSLLSLLAASACTGVDARGDRPVLAASSPLHLEAHLPDAMISSSELTETPVDQIEWVFEGGDAGWQPVVDPVWPESEADVDRTDQGLSIAIRESNRSPDGRFRPSVWVSLPGLDRSEWGHVLVRARATGAARVLQVWYNVTVLAPADDSMRANVPESGPVNRNRRAPFLFPGEYVPVVNDGTWQTYRVPITDVREQRRWRWHGDWRELVLMLGGTGEQAEGGIEIASVTLVPKAAEYGDQPFGRRDVNLGNRYRHSLFAHAPARVSYRVRVPADGRIDFALGSVQGDRSVTYRVLADSGAGADTLFEETWSDPGAWAQRSVDLSSYAGRAVELALDADATVPGSVALWGSPTVSGSSRSDRPNVILYIIDGGAAEAMSVYGYNRSTTPNIERIAAEGAVFDYAYSNSSWSKPSTTSFMTSLQNSVLGNTKERFDPLPPEALTMAERFHAAGHQTGVFTSNPWAGSASSLQRMVDWFRDEGVNPPSGSSVELHAEFWDWREAYPGRPFWAHFQTTDVHGPTTPIAPFAGLYISPERFAAMRAEQEEWGEWTRSHPDPGVPFLWTDMWKDLGIDRVGWFTAERDVYDEVLAHQDYQLGRFVERLKAAGEWERTIFVIAADHSYDAGSTDFGLVLQQELPHPHHAWGPMLRSTISRVPLIFVWPGHIAPGQRLSNPVSMIDVLPTLLELAGLPRPEVLQGQSLAPLLLGTGDIEPRPVILDQFSTDQRTGDLSGLIEVIDGRWGASLAINGGFEDEDIEGDERPWPLLVYDIWEDPLGLSPINEERPDLVEKYTGFLEDQWAAHGALADRFSAEGEVELTAEQLETLRTLGYIQ